MAQQNTFTMKEARTRYLFAFALLILFTSFFGYFPIAILIAAALQSCLFRLSKPILLAFLPALVLLPLLFVLYGGQSALILTAVLLSVGLILRMAQTKNVSKNFTVAAMTAAFVAASIIAFCLWLWKQNALSMDGLRLFFDTLQNTLISELRALFETSNTGASQEDIEAMFVMIEQSLADVILLLPCLLAIFFFALSCAVVGLYRLCCRLFRMKSGLPEKNWRFSLSMPFAFFYLLLLLLSFFDLGDSVFVVATNLRVLLSVFIAIVGTSMLIDTLSRAFPRVSSRFFCVLAIVFLCFSTYSVLVWQIIAAVTSVKIIITTFRKKPEEQ